MSNTPPNESTAAPQGICIEMLPYLTFSKREIGGRSSYICHHEHKGQFFHFGAAEYEAAKLLNGERTIPEVLGELKRLGVEWTPIDMGHFASMLLKCGLARVRADQGRSSSQSDSNASDPRHVVAHPKQLLLRGMASLISLRFPLFQADSLAAALSRRFGLLFSTKGVLLWAAILFSAFLISWENRYELGQQLKHLLAPQSWPWMIGLWSLIKIAHEAGHAIAARRQGVRIGQAGITLFLFAPLAWVNVTDAWRLPRRWARTQIALAGVYVELLIASIAIWVWWIATGEQTRHLAAQVAMLAGPATLLVNANPLLRLDGYYALSDWLDIPNLRMHGRRQVIGKLEYYLLGRKPITSLLEPWRARSATIHAFASILFQISWMTGLIIAVSLWARGLGIILAVTATLLWGVIPLLRWLLKLRAASDWRRVRWRLAGTALVAIGCVALIAAIPSPICRRIPAVIRYQEEQIARAASDGFITQVHVASGQSVQAGDLLVEMNNPDLRLRRDELQMECESSLIRSRQLRREQDHAMADAEIERLASLRRQLVELQRQVDSLQIRATRDGIVASYDLETLLNQYVRQGDVLIRIGNEQKKEVLASIPSHDLESYLSAVSPDAFWTLRLRGGKTYEISLRAPQPRATKSIPHPALAASAGGPLAVEAMDQTENGNEQEREERLQLVAPHSLSISPLTPEDAKHVRVGQQGLLIIGDTRSLWRRGYDRMQEALSRTK